MTPELGKQLDGLLQRVHNERQDDPGAGRGIAFGMRLRSLKALSPHPGGDVGESKKMKQAQRLAAAVENEPWISADLRKALLEFLEDYGCSID